MSTSSRPRMLQAWARNRLVVSYAVSPEHVAPHLPPGLVPDTRHGQAFVGLVGVELTKVRVLGISGPWLRRVPAVELQVLVREAQSSRDRRGTFAVRACVPRRLVAWGARFFGEPVEVVPMQPMSRDQTDAIEVTYRFDWAGREQRLRAVGETPPRTPVSDTYAAFHMKRNWRYGTRRDGSLIRARTERVLEPVYRVREAHVTIRWASVYGSDWAFLKTHDPQSVLLSPGGPIALRWRQHGQ